MQLLPPTVPYRGTRGVDAFGAGGFNAPRSRDGISYGHKGLDFLADPGDIIITPLPCFILTPGRAYSGSNLGSIHLEGIGEWRGYKAKLLYVAQDTTIAYGQGSLAGGFLGRAQDVAAYHEANAGDGRKMKNHVHFELYKGGELIDPTPLFKVV